MSSLDVTGRMRVDVTWSVGQLTLCVPSVGGLVVPISLLPWLVTLGVVVTEFSHRFLAVFNFLHGVKVDVLALLDGCGGLLPLLTIFVFIPDVIGVFLPGVNVFTSPLGFILCPPFFPYRCCIPCCDCSCGNLRLVPLP